MKNSNSQITRPAKLLAVATVAFSVCGFIGTIHAAEQPAPAQSFPSTFDGGKSTWHDDFVRYDFLMDKETFQITPFIRPENERFGVGTPPAGKLRCIVVVPKIPAPGNPWSWQACYWDHRPQAEVELLRRGFHIAFITPDPGKQWDAWYDYLTEKHGLSKKPAFVGMSKGGVNEYTWAGANPDKVSSIYADNPGIYTEDIPMIAGLIKHDVPLLNVCGTHDFVLEKNTKVIENIYHQGGGRISMMIKEGTGHHPHSLIDPKPIADFIEQHFNPKPTVRPEIVDDTFINTGLAVLVPKTAAAGKPWVFRADRIGPDASALDLALLAKGYYIVAAPITGGGPNRKEWDDVYKTMTDHGFSKKPAMEGLGAGTGEAYAWAIQNPDKVSCIYGENPVMRSIMASEQGDRHLADKLEPLAKAGVPILHVCGSLDPWLDRDTRMAEKNYQALGGNFTVIIRQGEGHFATGSRDAKPVVDFI